MNNQATAPRMANTEPVASDGTVTVAQDTVATGTLSASDIDGDSLTYTLGTPGSLGTATLTDPSTGAYTYTPQPPSPSTGQVTLAWDPPSSGPTQGYTIYQKQPGTAYVPIADVPQSPYTVAGLAVGQTYDFAVTAYNGSGESALSNEVTTTLSSPLTSMLGSRQPFTPPSVRPAAQAT